MDYTTKLQNAIKQMHGCDSTHVRTARVREVFQGRIVWNGRVEVFEITGNPRTRQCYAWSDKDDDGREHFTAVLELPPVDSPEKAIKMAREAQVKSENDKASSRSFHF